MLYEHFKGNLLNYKLIVTNYSDKVDPEVGQMIRLETPLKTTQTSFITNTSYSNYRKDIWPQSSLTVELKETVRMHKLMAFITRDMRFIGYNMTAMMDSGKIEKLYDR